MKSRGTARKNGGGLLNESLLLSCFGRLSSGIVASLKQGAFSRVLTGAPESDKALSEGLIGGRFKKSGAKRRCIRKIKTGFALSAQQSLIAGHYRNVLNRVMNTPVWVFGAFTATLGVYVCLVYLLKAYGFGALREVSESSFYIG